jgi:hypothetical protein
MTVPNLMRVPGDNPSGKEARLRPRYRVLLNAELVTTSDEQAVKVRDISRGGAMIEVRRPVAKGKEVILRRGSLELFANICWSSGKEIGLQFDDLLSEAEMIAFVQEPANPQSFVIEQLAGIRTADAGRSDLRGAACTNGAENIQAENG